MTPEKAYQILGLPITAEPAQIKKTYHRLLHQIHPDTDAFETEGYPYTIQEFRYVRNSQWHYILATRYGVISCRYKKTPPIFADKSKTGGRLCLF